MRVAYRYCHQEVPEDTQECLNAFAHARYLEQSRCGSGVRVTVYSLLEKSKISDLRPPSRPVGQHFHSRPIYSAKLLPTP